MSEVESSPALPERVLVLGCSGFIGSHLLERLLTSPGVTVTGVDTDDAKIRPCLAHPRFTLHKVRAEELGPALGSLVADCDSVVHLAALCNPSFYNRVPVDVITSNWLIPSALPPLCARLGKPLVFFSTSEVYGRTTTDPTQQPLREHSSPLILGPVHAQRWSYACAKQMMERWIVAHGHQSKLNYTILRPFNFIGPRMDFLPGVDGEGVPRVLACFMSVLLKGRPLPLVNGGSQQRTFTDIRDAVDATIRVLSHPAAARNQIFNIGNPANEISIRRFGEKLAAAFRAERPESGPVDFEDITGEEFYGAGYEDSARRVPDITLAREHLGWEPRIGLDQALRWTVSWYLEHYAADPR